MAVAGAVQEKQKLLKKVPSQANALLLMDVQALQKSARGVKEKWADQQQQHYLGGVTSIPPQVSKLVVAAQMDTASLKATTKYAIAELTRRVTELVAKLNPGKPS